jgi:hypothetical protein
MNDLSSLQSQILSYYQQKQMLPTALSELEDPTLYYNIPADPTTGAPYEYRKAADLSFELCATFVGPTRVDARGRGTTAPMAPYGGGVKGMDDWKHEAGRACFTRTIDPDFYPPFTKPVR